MGHSTRTAFTHDLRELQDGVMALGSMVEKAIAGAVDSLRDQDATLAQRVIDGDAEINRRRWQLEENALRLMALQAPLASDLRRIAAVMHVATDLERMADHAEGIAILVLRTIDEPLLKPLIDIPRMAELARAMLLDAIEAFVEDDADQARRVAARDDEIDQLYEQIYRELLTFMISDPKTISRATHLLWASHNIERIADRVTNICERVVFVVTGSIEELNRTGP
ncbi:MAG TPA: phosphate signaling complex protein PhoU [Thermomicrobiales bacterium]|nr:phosphate signaling complex protein PhoU [Thermomicrobiales bacterium]